MKVETAKLLVLFLVVVAAVIKQSPHLVFKVPLVGWALGLLIGFQWPPYIEPNLFEQCFNEENCPWLKAGDVVVDVCGKCGTNWMMTVVHELRTWDQPELREFRDILDVVPWPEMIPYPAANREHPEEEWGNFWNNSEFKFRIFKAHVPPIVTESNKIRSIKMPVRERRDVKILVMVRNPVDIFHSAATFFSSASNPQWNALWGDLPVRTSTPMEVFQRALTDEYFSPFNFFKEWMELAGDENVLILHYSNVFKDTKKSLKIIADFIGLKNIPEEAFDEINKRVSFEYMKKRGDKYTYLGGVNKSMSALYPSSVIKSGGSYAGGSKNKLTDGDKKKINDFGKKILGEEKNKMLAEGFEAIRGKKVENVVY